MKEIRCAEVGFFPDCPGTMIGEGEEEVMAAAAEQGRTVHGMTEKDFTDHNVAIRLSRTWTVVLNGLEWFGRQTIVGR